MYDNHGNKTHSVNSTVHGNYTTKILDCSTKVSNGMLRACFASVVRALYSLARVLTYVFLARSLHDESYLGTSFKILLQSLVLWRL